MADQFCASCDEIKLKCKYLVKEDIVFEMQGTNLVIKDATTGSLMGSVTASALCVALAATGCSLGGSGGATPMTPDQLAAALCSSPSAQATLGACLRDDVFMTGAEIAAALCGSQAAVNSLAACIVDEVLAEITGNATRTNTLADALDNRITTNLANDYLPMPVAATAANSLWVALGGASNGGYQTFGSLLQNPAHIAIICDALKAMGCGGMAPIRATFTWCQDVNDPAQRMVPRINIQSDVAAAVYLQKWDGAAWANQVFDDSTAAQTATAVPAGSPPGAGASGTIGNGANYIFASGNTYWRLFDGVNASRVFNVNMASGTVCPTVLTA